MPHAGACWTAAAAKQQHPQLLLPAGTTEALFCHRGSYWRTAAPSHATTHCPSASQSQILLLPCLTHPQQQLPHATAEQSPPPTVQASAIASTTGPHPLLFAAAEAPVQTQTTAPAAIATAQSMVGRVRLHTMAQTKEGQLLHAKHRFPTTLGSWSGNAVGYAGVWPVLAVGHSWPGTKTTGSCGVQLRC